MPPTVPPYPLADPHQDQMNRELYGRTGALQAVLGIDAEDVGGDGGEPPELGNIRITPVHPMRMAHRSILHSSGWGAGFSAPLTITAIRHACSVVAIYFNVQTPFPYNAARMKFFVSYNQRPPNNFNRSTIGPDDYVHDLVGPFGYAYRRHLAGSLYWTSQDQWKVPHGPIVRLYRDQYDEPEPFHFPYWQNAQRWIANPNEIESGYPLIITGGFMTDNWDEAPDWGTVTPAGKVYVTVLYMESVTGTLQVPLAEIGQHDLMSVNPVIWSI